MASKPLSVTDFCIAERIPPETWRRLSHRGLMPRPLVPAGRWRHIGRDEYRAWTAQREADRLRLNRPWLRYPAHPLSWVDPARDPELRALGDALHANAAAGAV